MDIHEYKKLQENFQNIQSLLAQELRVHIIERIKNGETQSEIARDLGVTRQRIFTIIKRYRNVENLPIDTRKQRIFRKEE